MEKSKILIVGAGPQERINVVEYLKQYGYSEEDVLEKIEFKEGPEFKVPKLEAIEAPLITKAELKKPKAWYDEMYYGYNPYRKGPMRFGGKKKGR